MFNSKFRMGSIPQEQKNKLLLFKLSIRLTSVFYFQLLVFELVSLLVNHSILLEERAKVYCACVRPTLLYAAETWTKTKRLEWLLPSYDHRMLRYMSKDGSTGLLVKRPEEDEGGEPWTLIKETEVAWDGLVT